MSHENINKHVILQVTVETTSHLFLSLTYKLLNINIKMLHNATVITEVPTVHCTYIRYCTARHILKKNSALFIDVLVITIFVALKNVKIDHYYCYLLHTSQVKWLYCQFNPVQCYSEVRQRCSKTTVLHMTGNQHRTAKTNKTNTEQSDTDTTVH